MRLRFLTSFVLQASDRALIGTLLCHTRRNKEECPNRSDDKQKQKEKTESTNYLVLGFGALPGSTFCGQFQIELLANFLRITFLLAVAFRN